MLFNSLSFAIFLPLVLAGYYLLGHKAQNRFLLAASLFFYACWDWRFLGLLLPLMYVDFVVAAAIERMREAGASARKRKALLVVSMASNLAVLGFFKYCNFFIESMDVLLKAMGFDVEVRTLNIVLPIGVSFFTFQSMSYTIDVYRGELPASKNFLDFALFVSFFPHLVAGPIMRATTLLPQVLQPRHATREQISSGIHLIIWGLWKKVFVADNLAPIVDATFAESDPSGFAVLTAVYAFAFQIYCDFSGYTDVARGVAKLMGFELGLNFNLPYFARNPQDFWNRWHISLSSWLRSYLYIPLGGNRGGQWMTYRNLLLTMILGGLWHGAAWTFLLWGFYQGLLLAIHRMWATRSGGVVRVEPDTGKLTYWLSVLVMFQFTCLGWLLFRATSISQVGQMSMALLNPFDDVDWERTTRILTLIMPIVVVQLCQLFTRNLEFIRSGRVPIEVRTACYSVLVYLILFSSGDPQSFIYFQF